MNADEIVTVVERFQSAWPWDTWNPERIDEWCTALEHVDDSVGATVTDRLIRHRERPPTIAVFLAEAHSEFERRRVTIPAFEPKARTIPAAVREALARLAGPKPVHQHHGGWRTCPTCSQYPPTGRGQDIAYRQGGPGSPWLIRDGEVPQ